MSGEYLCPRWTVYRRFVAEQQTNGELSFHDTKSCWFPTLERRLIFGCGFEALQSLLTVLWRRRKSLAAVWCHWLTVVACQNGSRAQMAQAARRQKIARATKRAHFKYEPFWCYCSDRAILARESIAVKGPFWDVNLRPVIEPFWHAKVLSGLHLELEPFWHANVIEPF